MSRASTHPTEPPPAPMDSTSMSDRAVHTPMSSPRVRRAGCPPVTTDRLDRLLLVHGVHERPQERHGQGLDAFLVDQAPGGGDHGLAVEGDHDLAVAVDPFGDSRDALPGDDLGRRGEPPILVVDTL